MASRSSIYKCEVCGHIIEVLHEGVGTLVCCGKPMVLQEENVVDAALEKHVPVIEGKKVKIGSIEHPMEEKHFIEWIEAWGKNSDERSMVFLKSGMKPESEFCFEVKGAREYCNLHGLWKK